MLEKGHKQISLSRSLESDCHAVFPYPESWAMGVTNLVPQNIGEIKKNPSSSETFQPAPIVIIHRDFIQEDTVCCCYSDRWKIWRRLFSCFYYLYFPSIFYQSVEYLRICVSPHIYLLIQERFIDFPMW